MRRQAKKKREVKTNITFKKKKRALSSQLMSDVPSVCHIKYLVSKNCSCVHGGKNFSSPQKQQLFARSMTKHAANVGEAHFKIKSFRRQSYTDIRAEVKVSFVVVPGITSRRNGRLHLFFESRVLRRFTNRCRRHRGSSIAN